jgi:PAS domain S-box-containing protein
VPRASCRKARRVIAASTNGPRCRCTRWTYEGRLNGISDYWCDLLGYARSDVIGQPLGEFCPLETADRLTQGLAVLLDGGELREVACAFRKKDGDLIDVLLSARLERDRLGRPLHILGALTDVTGRKQAERALRATEERLQQSQKMEAIGKLTGGIAHDFNNMLTVIDGNLEMLRPRLGEDRAALQFFEASARASGRAGTLTAQLLAFSRRQRLDPRPLDPNDVIDGMRSLLSRTVGEQVSLHIELRDGTPWSCLADRNQLEAALLNLVINATDAIEGQGRIRIVISNTSLRGADAAWLDPDRDDAVPPGDYVRISTEDDGCGMSEAVRRQALEPFFTTKPVGQGTGLGLSQTYGFVRQSGGAMRIESRPGRGTTVEMLLPRGAAMHDPQPALPRPPDARSSKASVRSSSGVRTLLVVEDEPEVLEIVASSLRDNGFEVICAPDAAHALAVLRANPLISLIFTDIVMPGINGVALAEEARRLRPGIPVVFASGYSDEAITEQLPKGSIFLQKPYRIASVTKLINIALAETQLSVA